MIDYTLLISVTSGIYMFLLTLCKRRKYLYAWLKFSPSNAFTVCYIFYASTYLNGDFLLISKGCSLTIYIYIFDLL